MELFKRYSEVMIHGRIYSSSDFDIDFDINFDSSDEIDLSEITIYNLTDSTRALFKKGQSIIVNAGYSTDIGSIFIGRVEVVDTDISGTEVATKLTSIHDATGYTGQRINVAFKSGAKATDIVNSILSGKGLELGGVRVGREIVYSSPVSFSGFMGDVIKQLAKDTDSKFYMKNNKFYFVPSKHGDDIRFMLNPDTGLIGSPQRTDVSLGEDNTVEGWKVQSLLNHRIGVDSIIEVRSRGLSGRLRVVRGSHSDFITDMEVVEA